MRRQLLVSLGVALVLGAAPAARGDVPVTFEEIDDAINNVDANVVLDAIEAQIDKHADDARWQILAGRSRSMVIDFTGAIAYFEKAIELDPTLSEAHLWLAESQLMLWRVEAARASLARALELGADKVLTDVLSEELEKAARISHKTPKELPAGSAAAAARELVARLEGGELLESVVFDRVDRSVIANALGVMETNIDRDMVDGFVSGFRESAARRFANGAYLGAEIGGETVDGTITRVPIELWTHYTEEAKRLAAIEVMIKEGQSPALATSDLGVLATKLSKRRWQALKNRQQATAQLRTIIVELHMTKPDDAPWRVVDFRLEGQSLADLLRMYKRARPTLEAKGLVDAKQDADEETAGYKIGQAVGRFIPIVLIVGLFLYYRRRRQNQ